MQLSKNFELKEFLVSADHPELIKDVIFKPWQIERIRCFIQSVLQPIRDALGKPLHITSGFRNKELNLAVNGHPGSHHMMLADHIAADFWVEDHTPADIIYVVRHQIFPMYRYIIEYDSFVHISGVDASGVYRHYIDYRSKDADTT